MSETPEVKYIKITGTTATGRRIEKYYTGTKKSAESIFLELPHQEGGVTSWSTEVVDSLPEYVYVDCPSCGHKFVNPELLKKT